MKEARNHLVTFRLTESEYRRLKAACGADRSSISNVVRQNVLTWVDSASEHSVLNDRLGQIADRLGHLVELLNERERSGG